jgi:hypothetical protein
MSAQKKFKKFRDILLLSRSRKREANVSLDVTRVSALDKLPAEIPGNCKSKNCRFILSTGAVP